MLRGQEIRGGMGCGKLASNTSPVPVPRQSADIQYSHGVLNYSESKVDTEV